MVTGCPSLPPPGPTTTWRVSWDIASGNLYFEQVGDNSGYYQCSGLDLSLTCIEIRFYYTTGIMTTTPPPGILGVPTVTDGSYTIIGNSIIASTSNLVTINGIPTTTANNARGYTITVQDNYDCFGLIGGGPWADICPLHPGNNCPTCIAYGSTYPCDSSCTGACYGPAVGMCCDPTCSSCFGITSGSCNACNNGYYLSGTNCLQCNSACANCTFSGTTSCSSCNSGYYSSSTMTCSACDPACATCTAAGASSCLTCNPGYFLQPSPSATTCSSTCLSGYWADNTTTTCQVCTRDSTNFSSCGFLTASKTASVLQNIATSFVAAAVTFPSALQGSSHASFMNFLLYLSTIESIANMQFLNINHSDLALEAYEGLAGPFVTNWIVKYNTIDSDQLVFNYGIFEKNQMSSLYLDNHGDVLTQIIVYWGVCLLGLILSKRQDPKKLMNSRTGKFYAITLGLFLSNVFGQIQSQLLFSILQILKIDLFVDFYSGASYFVACFTTSSMIGLLLFSLFKVKLIFAAKEKERLNKTSQRNLETEDIEDDFKARWKEKKYEMLFGDFKEDTKNRFFFTYWLCLFDTIYILLIIAFQSVPVLQCFSIFILTLGFIVFSAIVKPMKERRTAFSFFFNFGCTLSLAFVNLTQAISEAANGQAVNNNIPFGKAVYPMIMINTGVNLTFGIAGIGLGIISGRLKRNRNAKESAQVKELNAEISLSPNPNTSIRPPNNPESSQMTQVKEDQNFENHLGNIIHRKKPKLLKEGSARPSQLFSQVGYSDGSPSKINAQDASPLTLSPGHFLNFDCSRIDGSSSKRITDDVNGNFIQDL